MGDAWRQLDAALQQMFAQGGQGLDALTARIRIEFEFEFNQFRIDSLH